MPTIEPKVSVIIPTKGREKSLLDSLSDLDAQTYKNFDVWVVDQNESKLSGLKLSQNRLVHHQMPPLGSHAGRNYAIFRTDAEICIFVDDDISVDKNFIAKHVQAFQKQPLNVGFVSGRVVQPKDNLSDDQMRLKQKLASYNSFFGLTSGNFFGFNSGFVQHIHECNFSARTSVLRSIGGFNMAFEGNAYFEGADLALRGIRSGFFVWFESSISLIHLQAPSGGNRVQKKSIHTYWYFRNYLLLNSIHQKRVGVPFFIIWSIFYLIGKSLKNRDVSIFNQGFLGLLAGLKYFFNPKLKFNLGNNI